MRKLHQILSHNLHRIQPPIPNPPKARQRDKMQRAPKELEAIEAQ